ARLPMMLASTLAFPLSGGRPPAVADIFQGAAAGPSAVAGHGLCHLPDRIVPRVTAEGKGEGGEACRSPSCSPDVIPPIIGLPNVVMLANTAAESGQPG